MAGAINLANIAIGFDTSKLQKGTEFSRAELRTLNKVVQDSVSPVDRYNRELQLLEKAHRAGAVSADRMAQSVSHLQAKYKQGMPDASSMSGIGGSLKGISAQYLGLAAVGGAVAKSLSLAAVAESNKISLEVLTGSAQKAQMLFDGFIELDRNSPLSRSEFSKAAQVLIGYGYAAESTLPTLERLSQISMGNADKLQSLSLAFGQVQANGRLMGQEVLQMINAGFNPLQEISRTTGKGMVQLKTELEAGAISAGMVEDAFKSATSEGGRFNGMNERLKDSLSGQFSKLSSDIEMAATEMGTNLTPAAMKLMQVLSPLVTNGGSGISEFFKTFGIGLEGAIAIGQDAFTNLDGNSQGQEFGKLQDRLGTDKLQKEMEREHVHVQTLEEKARIAKVIADRQAKEREEIEAIAKKEKEALEAKKQADELAKQAAAQKKRDTDEASRKAAQAFEDLIDEADRFKKSVESPFEKYESEFNRLQELFNEGFIDEETFNRGNKKALSESASKVERDNNPNNIAETIAPALRAGSVEAYKFFMDQKEDAAQIGKDQLDVQRELLESSKRQIDAIENIQPVGRAR